MRQGGLQALPQLGMRLSGQNGVEELGLRLGVAGLRRILHGACLRI
jgi:hypothetical protein